MTEVLAQCAATAPELRREAVVRAASISRTLCSRSGELPLALAVLRGAQRAVWRATQHAERSGGDGFVISAHYAMARMLLVRNESMTTALSLNRVLVLLLGVVACGEQATTSANDPDATPGSEPDAGDIVDCSCRVHADCGDDVCVEASADMASDSLCCASSAPACGSFDWAASVYGDRFGSRVPKAIVTDSGDNTIVTIENGWASLEGAIVHSTAHVGPFVHTSTGREDTILAKYDSAGNVLWSRQFGGEEMSAGGDKPRDSAYDLAVDGHDNIFMVGNYGGIIDFGCRAMESTNDTGVWGFVAKFEPENGDCLWQIRLGRSISTIVHRTQVDSVGDVYAAGEFWYYSTDFSDDGVSDPVSPKGERDMFIAKYSGADGSLLWKKTFGEAGGGAGINAFFRDPSSGNLTIGGAYGPSMDFSDAGGKSRSSVEGSDGFVAQYDADGDYRWVTTFNGADLQRVMGIAIDADANSYVVGTFRADLTVGDLSLQSMPGGDGRPSYDLFVVKLTPQGTPLWARRFGGTGSDSASSVAIDPTTGLVAIGGNFSSPMSISSGQVLEPTSWDVFLMRLNPGNGEVTCAQAIGTANARMTLAHKGIDMRSDGHLSLFAELWGDQGTTLELPGVDTPITITGGGPSTPAVLRMTTRPAPDTR